MTRPGENQITVIIHVDELPNHSHLEADCTEYGDAVQVRGVDEDTGVCSQWSTLPVRDGWVEVTWAQLWISQDRQPSRLRLVPRPRKPTDDPSHGDCAG